MKGEEQEIKEAVAFWMLLFLVSILIAIFAWSIKWLLTSLVFLFMATLKALDR